MFTYLFRRVASIFPINPTSQNRSSLNVNSADLPDGLLQRDVEATVRKTRATSSNRIESIDLLRGFVMVIMAIDHVRDLFHTDSFVHSPTDITHTTAGLFFTRWITHLCAPTFIFLAGTSAYFVSQRKTTMETSRFLFSRGFWLIVLQITIVRFGWNFDPLFRYNSNTILSVIGISMIVLGALIHFKMRTIFAIGLLLVAGHNLLDDISFPKTLTGDMVWSFLHVQKAFVFENGYSLTFVYPLIPWPGVMALGYCFGQLYSENVGELNRKKTLMYLGSGCILMFCVLRLFNIYGDPMPWSGQADLITTFMSFLNVAKYPPSLLYLLITLGISFLILATLEGSNFAKSKYLIAFGKAALFYYVAHIYLIHVLALLAAVIMGYQWKAMIFPGSLSAGSQLLTGYGFSLGVVYVVWIAVILILYPLCVYWNSFKTRHRDKWWVSYV